MSRAPRAVVVGAGIAGLALADRLATRGWAVTVVERAAGPRTEGYVVDFFGPGYDAAERAGLLPRLRELAVTVDELTYVGPTGRPRVRLDVERLARAVDGRFLSIARPDLERALRERVEGRAELRYGLRPDGVVEGPERALVTLSDGTAVEADLVVGADGIHSWIRRAVVAPVLPEAGRVARAHDPHLRPLGMHTATFTLDHPGLRDAVGRRVWLTDTLHAMVGFYPLADDRVAVFAAHRTDEPLPADPRAELHRRYGSWPWLTGTAMAACPPADQVYYDTVAQVDAPRWQRGRVVLLGDACQAVSFVAGQGASLAVAGAAVLDAALSPGAPVPDALARYEARWRPVVRARQAAGRAGARWFLPATRRARWLRRAGLLLAATPGLDRPLRGVVVGRSRVRVDDLDLGAPV